MRSKPSSRLSQASSNITPNLKSKLDALQGKYNEFMSNCANLLVEDSKPKPVPQISPGRVMKKRESYNEFFKESEKLRRENNFLNRVVTDLNQKLVSLESQQSEVSLSKNFEDHLELKKKILEKQESEMVDLQQELEKTRIELNFIKEKHTESKKIRNMTPAVQMSVAKSLLKLPKPKGYTPINRNRSGSPISRSISPKERKKHENKVKMLDLQNELQKTIEERNLYKVWKDYCSSNPPVPPAVNSIIGHFEVEMRRITSFNQILKSKTSGLWKINKDTLTELEGIHRIKKNKNIEDLIKKMRLRLRDVDVENIEKVDIGKLCKNESEVLRVSSARLEKENKDLEDILRRESLIAGLYSEAVKKKSTEVDILRNTFSTLNSYEKCGNSIIKAGESFSEASVSGSGFNKVNENSVLLRFENVEKDFDSFLGAVESAVGSKAQDLSRLIEKFSLFSAHQKSKSRSSTNLAEKEKISEMQSQINQLTLEKEEAFKLKKAVEEDKENLLKQWEITEKRLQQENNAKKEELFEKLKQVEKLENALKLELNEKLGSISRTEGTVREIRDLQEKLNKANENILILNENLRIKNEEISLVSNENEKISQELNQSLKDFEELSREKQKTEKKLEIFEFTFEKEIKKYEEQCIKSRTETENLMKRTSEIEGLRKTLKDAEVQIHGLLEQIEFMKNQKTVAENENKSLNENLKNSKISLNEIQGKLEGLEQSLKSHEKIEKDLREKLKNYESKEKDLREQVKSHESIEKDLESKIENYESIAKDLRKQIKHYEAIENDLKLNKETVKKYEKKITEVEEDCSQYKLANQELEKQFQVLSVFKQSSEKKDEIIQDLKKNLVSYEKEISLLAINRELNDDIQTQLENYKNRITILQELHKENEKINEEKAEEIVSLLQIIQEKDKEIETLNKAKTRLSELAGNKEEELKSVKTLFDNKAKENENLVNQFSNLSKRLEEEKDKQAKVFQANKLEKVNLEEQLKELQTVQLQLTELKTNYDRKSLKCKTYKEKSKSLVGSLNELSEKNETISNLTQALNQLNSEIETVERQKFDLQDKLVIKEQEIKDLESKILKIEQDSLLHREAYLNIQQELWSTKSAFSSESQIFNSKIKDCEIKISSADKEISSLKTELDCLREEKKRGLESFETVKNELDSLKSRSQAEINDNTRILNEQKDLIDSLNSEILSLNEELKSKTSLHEEQALTLSKKLLEYEQKEPEKSSQNQVKVSSESLNTASYSVSIPSENNPQQLFFSTFEKPFSKESIEELNSLISSLTEKNHLLEVACKKLVEDINSYKSSIQEKLDDLKLDKYELTKENEDLKKRINSNLELEKALKQEQEKQEKKIKEINNQKTDLESAASKLLSELEEKNKKIAEISQDITNSNNYIQKILKEKETAERSLENLSKNATLDNSQIRNEMSALRVQVSKLESINSDLDKSKNLLDQKLKKTIQEKSEINERQEDLYEEIEGLKQIRSKQSTQISDLEKQILVLQDESEKDKRLVQDYKNKLATYIRNNSALEKELRSMTPPPRRDIKEEAKEESSPTRICHTSGNSPKSIDRTLNKLKKMVSGTVPESVLDWCKELLGQENYIIRYQDTSSLISEESRADISDISSVSEVNVQEGNYMAHAKIIEQKKFISKLQQSMSDKKGRIKMFKGHIKALQEEIRKLDSQLKSEKNFDIEYLNTVLLKFVDSLKGLDPESLKILQVIYQVLGIKQENMPKSDLKKKWSLFSKKP